VLSLALGMAFRNRPIDVVRVAVTPAAAEWLPRLDPASGIHAETMAESDARRALRLGRVVLVLDKDPGGGVLYRYDDARPDGMVARLRVDDALQRAVGRRDVLPAEDALVREPGSRYIDFLIPGMLGMNLMSGGMWGMGFHLVDMRIKRLLKRLVATPMYRSDFLVAQMLLRVVFMFIEVVFLLGFGYVVFDVPVRGSIPAVLVVGLLGALAFGGLGLLVASRAMTLEKVTGLMNVVMMPMFIASGTFFSSDRFPDVVQPLVQALPLTALNDALRAVILEGATLASQSHELAIVTAWGLLSFLIGLRLFRWS